MAKVLVVDDIPDSCRVLVRLLERIGHDAECVLTGAAALDYLRANVPDLVVLDAMMPDVDGTEVLRRIRADERTRAVPVVVYSALSDPAFREHVLRLGANDFWVKTTKDLTAIKHRIFELLPS